LFAIYDSHDAFVVSRSQMLAAVARSMGVLASALVLVPYQYKRKMSFEDTAYVTIFPISPLVNPRLYIMNVIRTIVKPITLDGLCGIDLADTATTFRNGQIGYCGCGRDKHEIGNAAVNAVNKVKKLCPNISVATGGLSHIETGRRSTLEGLELALAVIYSSIGGHCDFFWQHRCSQSLSAPVMVSLIAVYNSSSYAFF
jgi:hypothetical protein